MTITNLITTGLSTYRLTRLVIQDEITVDIRNKVFEKFPPHENKIGYFLTCPWCVSIWAGAGLIVLDTISPKTGAAVKNVLAASAIAGIVSSHV